MARSSRKPMSDINVVPYIDVMLVLLIIFMVTAPMLTQGVKVDLPQVESDPVNMQEDQEPLIITVDSNAAYYLEIGDQTGKPMELATLQERVSLILQQNPKVSVLVRGDRHVEYGVVVDLMSVLQQSGADGVGLVTENP
ncbi:protein TolR [Alkalimarinus sediminis]|uniref:Tol-Pal system protein TolR n=1 Tax=Alkalimarinus sediminis TaxID=1632866 RepID=A0A9E8KRA1_9ALTE|nr:protein TolR [Alkalimarinus sediminis]UZW75817.1 protein TolR [Alkalimarinus sediminis]